MMYKRNYYYVYEYYNGSVRDHVAVWDYENHPNVTDEQWEEMLAGKEVLGDDGCYYGIDDDDVERW